MKDEGGEEKGGVLCDVYDTVLTACSVEACPAPTRSHLLVCGTYQLNKETEERTGGLSLHEVVLAGACDIQTVRRERLPVHPARKSIIDLTLAEIHI